MLNNVLLKFSKRMTVLMAGVGVLLAVVIAMIYSNGSPILWKVMPSAVFGFTAFGIGIDNFTKSRRRRFTWALLSGLLFSFVSVAIEMFGRAASFPASDFLMYFISFAFLPFLPEELFGQK